jgi:hypothetical protein
VSVRRARAQVRIARSTVPRQLASSIYAVDPLQDPRWTAFLDQHPRASVFHSVPWLHTLHTTYGFEPIVYTTSPPGADLRNGIVFCRVESWITGRRLVSLPFSDHCEPLVDSTTELESMLAYLQAERRSGGWKYIEIRPAICSLKETSSPDGFQPFKKYYLHTIGLDPQMDQLVRRFHKTSVQQRLRGAERNGLRYECGRSDFLLEKFYALLLLARRRHQVPPQPREWFRNLRDRMGDALQIHLASHGNTPVAAVLTIRFKNTAVYKYGGSNQAYHRIGSVPFVLAKAIGDAKSNGAQIFDLGRSDYDNLGLIQFKNNWASTATFMNYWRFPALARESSMAEGRSPKLAKRVFQSLPDSVLKLAGEILYRHVG